MAEQLEGNNGKGTSARITLEIQAGLESLSTNNSSLSGSIRHQR
jgi:hypothetical protein